MTRKPNQSLKHASSHDSSSSWEVIIFVGLFLCAFLVPTEAPELGETLWLSCAWLGLAALTCWLRSKFERPIPFELRAIDSAVLLIVFGHCASGLALFVEGGNLRSALNMTIHWLALISFWFLLRIHLSDLRTKAVVRSSLMTTFIVLSLFGIWQHFVLFPQQAAAIQEFVDLQAMVEAGQELSAEQREQYRALLDSVGGNFVSLDPQGRQSFLARIRDSVEPIGRFALANTFAAMLLVGCLFGVSQTLLNMSQWNWSQRVIATCFLITMAYCLILTKSRTATWVALPVGLIIILFAQWRSRAFGLPVLKYGLLGGTCVVMSLVVLAVATGGLDPEVVSEAPKSLQYRLEYWTSTTQLLADHPVFGVGPGNFRQRYLQYKLPGASEEIIDPHNLILDVWANGGIIALIGLLAFIALTFLTIFRRPANHNDSKHEASNRKNELWCQLVAYAIVTVVSATIGGVLDTQLLWMFGLAVVVTLLHPTRTTPVFKIVKGAAFSAVIVHLLGSGGIEMPAIVQLLMFLSVSIIPAGESQSSEQKSFGPTPLRLLAAVFGILFIVSCLTGLVPVFSANAMIQQGRSVMMNPNYANRTQAKQLFLEAIETDPLSPEPQQWLSQWYFHSWATQSEIDSQLFQKAIDHQQIAIQLDPHNSSHHELLGDYWSAKFEKSQDVKDIQNSIDAYQKAVDRYPNDSQRLASLAIALSAAKRDASTIAENALQLDDLNNDRGHYDKTLTPEIREQIELIVSESH